MEPFFIKETLTSEYIPTYLLIEYSFIHYNKIKNTISEGATYFTHTVAI